MLGKWLLIIGIIPVVVSFFLAQYFGRRRLSSEFVVEKSAGQAAEAVLKGTEIETKLGKPLWSGANPLKAKIFTLDKKKAESARLVDVADLAHSAGLATLSIAHQKSVLYYYKIQRFAGIFPIFMIVVAVMGRLAGRVPSSLCLGLISVGLGIAAVGCMFQLATLREAAKRAVHSLEKNGFSKRMSERDVLEQAIYGIAYLKILPACLQLFLPKGARKVE